MKEIAIFWCFLFPTIFFAQEQVSFNTTIFHDYKPGINKYFVELDESEYFIERYETFTSVSKISENSLEFMHNIMERPIDGGYINSQDYRNSNSGLLIEDDLLYDLYEFNIQVIDVVGGEVVKDIDLCQYNIGPLSSGLVFQNDLIFFRAYQGDVLAYFIYDRNTETVERVDWSMGKQIYWADRYLYSIDDNSNAVISYDLIEGTEIVNLDIGDNIESSKIDYKNLEPVFLLVSNNIIYEYEEGELAQSCSCYEDLDVEINNFLFKGGLLFASIFDSGEYKVEVRNIETCELINSIIGPSPGFGGPEVFDFQEIRGLTDRYLLMSANGAYFSLGTHVIYDLIDDSYQYYDINTDYFLEYQTVLIDDFLYIIGVDEVELYGSVHECFAIDLENKIVNKVILEEGINMFFMRIGESRSNETLSVYSISENDDVNLWQINVESYQSSHLKEMDVSKNFGLGIFENVDVLGGRIYFENRSELYVIEDNTTSNFLTASGQTQIIEKDGIGYIMAERNQDVLLYKINIESNLIDSIVLDGVLNGDGISGGNKDVIFNFRNFSAGIGYIDLITETFVPMPFLAGFARIIKVNDQGAIIHSHSTSEGSLIYHFNTKTKEYKVYNIGWPRDAIDDGLGGFYLLFFENGDSTNKITHIGKNGDIIDEIELAYSGHFRELDEIRFGDKMTIPLLTDDEIKFVLTQNQSFNIYSLRYDDISSFTKVFIRSNSVYTVTETFEAGNRKLYLLSHDFAPVEIPSLNAGFSLKEAVFICDQLTLFYHDQINNQVHIEVIDLNSLTVVKETKFDITKAVNPIIEIQELVDNKIIILSINNGTHGQELFQYNLINNSLELLFDLRQGYLGSEPSNYVILGDYRYFKAIGNDGSRQWFRYHTDEFLEIESSSTNENIVFPNPAHYSIKMSQNLTDLQIFNSQGQECFLETSGLQIDVSQLTSGVYFIVGNNGLGESVVTSFVKQ